MTDFNAAENQNKFNNALLAIARTPPNRETPIGHVLDAATAAFALASSIGVSLSRIADAVEAQAELANVDINETIKAGVAAGIEDAVNQRIKENSERGFIGRKAT